MSAVISPKSLFWKRIPLFHIDLFTNDFSGNLYFVLGQGLGDHVNGFRILQEIMIRFPKTRCIVYADLRWKDLALRIKGIEIRWYPKAKDVLSREGTNNPYDPTHAQIKKEIDVSQGNSFLAYAHFPMPDRHSRRETTLEATVRAIGLDLKEKARPFLPILDEDLEWAGSYLKKYDLEKGCYAVIAPYSWPNKVWKKENFSRLIDEVEKRFGLRTIVISYPEIGFFDNRGTVCAFDLTLGQIAGLMNYAGLYIGLDSGPSHMAASFDLPMVTIFVEKRTIPFEVRPLSPKCLNVVESFFTSVSVPCVETVLESIAYVLQNRQGSIVNCPICSEPMNYVLSSQNGIIRLMCSCGIWMDSLIKGIVSTETKKFPLVKKDSHNDSFEFDSRFSDITEFLFLDKIIDQESPQKIIVRISQQSLPGFNVSSELKSNQFHLSFDGLLIWLNRKGYSLNDLKIFSEKLILNFEKGGKKTINKSIKIPWGRIVLNTNQDRYLRWFSFERWGKPESLVGIVKSQAELGVGHNDMLACSWIAFKTEPSFRSFRWVFKASFFRVFRLLKQ